MGIAKVIVGERIGNSISKNKSEEIGKGDRNGSIEFKFNKCMVTRTRDFQVVENGGDPSWGKLKIEARRENGKCQAEITITNCPDAYWIISSQTSDRRARIDVGKDS